MIAASPASNPPSVVQAASPAHPAKSELVYGFAGTVLGQALNAWRTTAPGRGAACSPGAPHGDIMVCHGDDIALGGGFMARDPTFTFVGGRLSKIWIRSSIDGFAFAMAALKHRFGQPHAIVRDRIIAADGLNRAHVAITWRNGRSTITLNDPSADAAHLEVNMHLDAAFGERPRQD
jgi:hypothetical protein